MSFYIVCALVFVGVWMMLVGAFEAGVQYKTDNATRSMDIGAPGGASIADSTIIVNVPDCTKMISVTIGCAGGVGRQPSGSIIAPRPIGVGK